MESVTVVLAGVVAASAVDEPVTDVGRLLQYGVVQGLDPLGVDEFMTRLPGYLAAGELLPILVQLSDVVSLAATGVVSSVEACYAGLRDLDFIVSAAHAIEPCSYQRVAGLEGLLDAMGRTAGHSPRGCNFTYGLFNPADGRMRTFSGLSEERVFVHAIQSGTRNLDQALLDVRDLATHRVGSDAFVAAANRLVDRFDAMVAAVRRMQVEVPAEVFSDRIVRYMQPLEINGRVYSPVTGAQVQNVGIDYLLFGVGTVDPGYVGYVAAGLAAMLPFHQAVIRDALQTLSGVSVLERVSRDLIRGDVNREAAGVALRQLDRFVSTVLSFRAVHRRLAVANIPLRPDGQGSGGHDLTLLDGLIGRTREARQHIRHLLSQLGSTEPDPGAATVPLRAAA